jgi:hypothetical protein
MTVQELIEHLQTLPQDLTVHFRVYGSGYVWHQVARTEDFVEETHIDTSEKIVEITADWN